MHSRGRCTIMGALLRSLGGVRHPLRASVAQIVQMLTLTIPRANGGTTASNRAHLLTGILGFTYFPSIRPSIESILAHLLYFYSSEWSLKCL